MRKQVILHNRCTLFVSALLKDGNSNPGYNYDCQQIVNQVTNTGSDGVCISTVGMDTYNQCLEQLWDEGRQAAEMHNRKPFAHSSTKGTQQMIMVQEGLQKANNAAPRMMKVQEVPQKANNAES